MPDHRAEPTIRGALKLQTRSTNLCKRCCSYRWSTATCLKPGRVPLPAALKAMNTSACFPRSRRVGRTGITLVRHRWEPNQGCAYPHACTAAPCCRRPLGVELRS